MEKKLISICLALSVFLIGIVSAAEVKISDGEKNVTVSHQIDSESNATLIVVKSGKSINSNDDVYAIVHTKADSAGEAVWTFGMEEKRNEVLTDGEYDLYIKVPGKDFIQDKMIYSSLESRNLLLLNLRAVTNDGELATIINNENNRTVLMSSGFDIESYLKLTDFDDEIIKNTFSNVNNFSEVKVDIVARTFNKAIAVVGLREDGSNADKYLTLANPLFDEGAYLDISDENLKKWLSSQMNGKDISQIGQIETEYTTANILYIINNARVSDISGVLDIYDDRIGLNESSDYIAYKALKSKSKADETIVNTLKLTPATSVSSLGDVIRAGVNAANSNNSNTGTGGGGGSASGGNGKSSVAASAIPVSTEVKRFTDLHEAAWASDAINKMADNGIVAGDGNGKFRPNDTMTRDEFVKMIVSAANVYDDNAECEFTDCLKTDWFYGYIASAYNRGIVKGISDDEFGVGQKLTRQDMAVLCRRAKYGELNAVRSAEQFTDDEKIADYAKDIVYELYCAGMINGMGDGRFEPLGTATRAQGAMIIYNLFIK